MYQLTSLIFGVFVVLAFNQVWINGSFVHATWSFEEIGRAIQDMKGVEVTDDKNVIDWWFGQLFKPKPSTTTPFPEPEKPAICPPCKCGLTNTQNRIVGGIETKKNQYPWMAQMMNNGKFYCGASVINDRYVLTAAHCVDRFDMETIVIRIGDHNRSTNTEARTQDFRVDRITKHNGYSTVNYNNDIALVRLRGSITFTDSMHPVCLAEEGPTYAGKMAVVTGWGATREGGSTSDTLLEVTVPIMTNDECRAMKYPARRITDNMMCAGYVNGGKDSCQGDSGGPMHIITEKVHRIVGIVSWGEGCALPNYPGVYTRLNRYLTWLKTNTRDACYCH